jgi:spore photoproduct lyase
MGITSYYSMMITPNIIRRVQRDPKQFTLGKWFKLDWNRNIYNQENKIINAEDSQLKVFFKEVINLRGEIERVVDRVGDGSIIKLFDKTPPPQKAADVVCPHFLELKWANGCYFNCAWCYLNGTYRYHPDWKNGKPNIKDFKLVETHLRAFFSSDGIQPQILNTGELSDSLLAEDGDIPFSKFIANVFNKYDPERKHKLLFLTKSIDVKNLLELMETERIVMSFSLNAFEVAKRWEKAPSVEARIKAAKQVYEAGYLTRIRIDPMVPVMGWKEQYKELVNKIFSSLTPERITLGSLRGLASTIANSKDKSWVIYLSEKSNWGKKIDSKTRFEMYSTLIDYLEDEYNYKQIALCKETLDMWQKLGLDYKEIKCNCTL